MPVVAVIITLSILFIAGQDADGLSIPQLEKHSTFIEPHGLIMREHDFDKKTIFYVWNPENKTLTFTNIFVEHGYPNMTPNATLHETYNHWQIINTTDSSTLWVDGVHQINSTTLLTNKEFILFNYWYEREQEQNKIINSLENKIESLEDKLGKQGKRIQLLEAQIKTP